MDGIEKLSKSHLKLVKQGVRRRISVGKYCVKKTKYSDKKPGSPPLWFEAGVRSESKRRSVIIKHLPAHTGFPSNIQLLFNNVIFLRYDFSKLDISKEVDTEKNPDMGMFRYKLKWPGQETQSISHIQIQTSGEQPQSNKRFQWEEGPNNGWPGHLPRWPTPPFIQLLYEIREWQISEEGIWRFNVILQAQASSELKDVADTLNLMWSHFQAQASFELKDEDTLNLMWSYIKAQDSFELKDVDTLNLAWSYIQA